MVNDPFDELSEIERPEFVAWFRKQTRIKVMPFDDHNSSEVDWAAMLNLWRKTAGHKG